MLGRLLPHLPGNNNPDILIGSSTSDDAGVYRISSDQALVQTVDFFTPIVDDPYDFGRISAVNSLSDVYAMGGRPLTALNIFCFPEGDLPEDVMLDILRGGAEICTQANVALLGGHSVSDKELKYGLSVTGVVHPDKVISNAGGQPGDALYLTKPLGTGLISNALMNGVAADDIIQSAVDSMIRLNRIPAELAVAVGVHAMTDITGFGLLGHLSEVIRASGLEAVISAFSLPVLPGAMQIAGSGSYFSGGERKNQSFVESTLVIDPGVEEAWVRLAVDPQTSGGLLIAISVEKCKDFEESMQEAGEKAWKIGCLEQGEPGRIRLQATYSESDSPS